MVNYLFSIWSLQKSVLHLATWIACKTKQETSAGDYDNFVCFLYVSKITNKTELKRQCFPHAVSNDENQSSNRSPSSF